MFWLFFSCAILFVIGLTKVIKDELPQEHGLDKILPFGRLFYAIPIGVPGSFHLTHASGSRESGSALDAPALILDGSGGDCADCRGAEHHPGEACGVVAHTFGMHVSTFRGFDAYP